MKHLQTPSFVEDITPKGTLYAVIVRSPVSDGRLLSIEYPRMPGSYTLIRASDIPGENSLTDTELPILAEDRISYKGEPLAILVGPDLPKLEEYASQCTVKTEAASPAPQPDADSGEALESDRKIFIGDPDTAFKGTKTIVTGSYRTGIQEHWYSDPSGAVALLAYDKMLVYTATQWPFHVRQSVSRVLNVKADDIVVNPCLLGIHLDGKLWYPSLVSCHAALAAMVCKKPVKLILTRQEDFRFSPKRHGSEITIRTALGKKGEILGTAIEAATDIGSHAVFAEETLDRICLGSVGSYKFSNLKIEGHAVKTATPPRGPFAGFGLSQGFFAAERHISKIADSLHQDPLEWRKNHVLNRTSHLAMGIPFKENVSLESLLDSAAAMSDYNRKWASYELLRTQRRESGYKERLEALRGIGIAMAYQGSGFLYEKFEKNIPSVELTLDKDGRLEIKTSMVSADNENALIWQQLAADMLSLEADAIQVVMSSTDKVPDSGPSCLSRNITVVTKLIERACSAIRKQRFRDPLPITVKRSYKPAKGISWANTPIDQNALTHLSWAAGVVEVEIDPIELTPKVRGVWMAVDGGKILSEQRARSSLNFSISQALGWASRERLSYEDGVIPENGMLLYNIPASQDLPPIHIDFAWNDTVNPRGIGELAFSCIPAAYAQAVSQAADYSFESIPITAKDVWEVKKIQQEAEAPGEKGEP
ncbi:xanthine dehydrogenase family protein molybdopterin-binding subunit [Breznakiella homolactica]|uniref:Xanthine dehydrogenase family protein n=1 Tax=Breznakiella homolactica TaxID=2798577 RepID=A0A7T7XKQ7_9SPIR|nr:xanthine dehydrogenase family protein [Breznakiella homolactica]QQO08052.1 xanthine dehydrogenase family protein molybdopterin-binding subunit [Breznakiella homolactica]